MSEINVFDYPHEAVLFDKFRSYLDKCAEFMYEHKEELTFEIEKSWHISYTDTDNGKTMEFIFAPNGIITFRISEQDNILFSFSNENIDTQNVQFLIQHIQDFI